MRLVRSPRLGSIQARDRVIVDFGSVPLSHEDVPVLLTQDPETLKIGAVTPDNVEIINLTDHPVGYLIVVTRRSVLQLVSAPWKRYLDGLKTCAGRSELLLAFNKFVLSRQQLGK